jgi:hypothetical protein
MLPSTQRGERRSSTSKDCVSVSCFIHHCHMVYVTCFSGVSMPGYLLLSRHSLSRTIFSCPLTQTSLVPNVFCSQTFQLPVRDSYTRSVIYCLLIYMISNDSVGTLGYTTSSIWITVNNELEKTRKETALAYFLTCCPGTRLEGLEKTINNRRYSSRESNWVFHEYRLERFLLGSAYSVT